MDPVTFKDIVAICVSTAVCLGLNTLIIFALQWTGIERAARDSALAAFVMVIFLVGLVLFVSWYGWVWTYRKVLRLLGEKEP